MPRNPRYDISFEAVSDRASARRTGFTKLLVALARNVRILMPECDIAD